MVFYKVVKSLADRRAAYTLRYEVFVREQQVPPEMELDESDKDAVHVIALENGAVIGTGRLVVEGNRGRVGRMAVSETKRGQGVGKGLVISLENVAKTLSLREIYLHAQTHAQKFYTKQGYQARGDTFDEAGIQHIEMFKLI